MRTVNIFIIISITVRIFFFFFFVCTSISQGVKDIQKKRERREKTFACRPIVPQMPSLFAYILFSIGFICFVLLFCSIFGDIRKYFQCSNVYLFRLIVYKKGKKKRKKCVSR